MYAFVAGFDLATYSDTKAFFFHAKYSSTVTAPHFRSKNLAMSLTFGKDASK